MAKAKKLPSGNWRCQAYKNGVTKSFTAPTKKDAEFAALEWQNTTDRISNGKASLSEAAEVYITKRATVVSPVTIATYKGYKKRYLTDLQSKYIDNITEYQLQTAFNELSKKLSPKTLKSVYGFFSAVFKEFDVTFKIILPKVYKKVYQTPDRETAKRILEIVRGDYIEVPVNLALRCGMRISEIRGLKFSKVKDNRITVDNVIVTVGREHFEKRPKSSAGVRTFPIAEDLQQMIDALPHDSEYVTTHGDKAINKRLHDLLKQNDMPAYTMHSLRHGFASAMAYLGIPEQYAMVIGGWDTSDTMHKIYMQTFDSAKQEFSERINNYFI